jgi:glycine dehydrogenase
MRHHQLAPHTLRVVTGDEWTRLYARAAAAYPRPWCVEGKVWPTVGRVDDVYGDTHLQCSW